MESYTPRRDLIEDERRSQVEILAEDGVSLTKAVVATTSGFVNGASVYVDALGASRRFDGNTRGKGDVASRGLSLVGYVAGSFVGFLGATWGVCTLVGESVQRNGLVATAAVAVPAILGAQYLTSVRERSK